MHENTAVARLGIEIIGVGTDSLTGRMPVDQRGGGLRTVIKSLEPGDHAAIQEVAVLDAPGLQDLPGVRGGASVLVHEDHDLVVVETGTPGSQVDHAFGVD